MIEDWGLEGGDGGNCGLCAEAKVFGSEMVGGDIFKEKLEIIRISYGKRMTVNYYIVSFF